MEDQRFSQDVHDIKNQLQKQGLRLELIYNALNGNELSKDGGLIAEIASQRGTIEDLSKRVADVEKKESQRQLYVRIIWAALSVIATLVASYFFKK